MEDFATMSLVEVAKLPGIADIQPLIARAKFAQALQAEARGEHERAAMLLDEAVARAE